VHHDSPAVLFLAVMSPHVAVLMLVLLLGS
jgi:hypothetical protein